MNTTHRVVFVSALYDLLVTWPFATPWSARALTDLLRSAHEGFQLPGASPSLLDPTALLFANLLGSIVVVWSVVRLARPTLALGLADTAGRALFATWMLYALTHGGSPVLVPFLVAEVLFGAAQLSLVTRASWRTSNAN